MYFDISRCRRLGLTVSKGYTLIEVLVAMAIFTAMLVLAGAAINQGLQQYQGLIKQGLVFWDYANKIWIDKSFISASDYYVYTRSDGWFPYFKGRQDSISYVSLAPFAGEFPVLAWIKIESQVDGKRTLRYYELPAYAKTFEEIERDDVLGDYKKGKSFNLLDDVENATFSFFGCDVDDRRKCQWSNLFDGNKAKALPLSVKIEYSLKGEKGVLIFDVRVNSYRKISYNEIYSR